MSKQIDTWPGAKRKEARSTAQPAVKQYFYLSGAAQGCPVLQHPPERQL
jgi:hypothetical protein